MSKVEQSLETLKQEADELGIKYSGNIGVTALQAKIDAHYKKIEEGDSSNSVNEIPGVPTNNTTLPTKAKSFLEKARDAEKAARKTLVVRILDNDQRQNNHTTTVTAHCSNAMFDLGSVVLPLNMPVEVMQGHIDTLKEVQIPAHVKDYKTGLATTELRPRYTISVVSDTK